MGQSLGYHYPTFHAARQGPDFCIFLVPQGQIAQHFFDIGRIWRFTKQATTEFHRGQNGFEGIGGKFLRHQADF